MLTARCVVFRVLHDFAETVALFCLEAFDACEPFFGRGGGSGCPSSLSSASSDRLWREIFDLHCLILVNTSRQMLLNLKIIFQSVG